jgi:WD40 repeat protein
VPGPVWSLDVGVARRTDAEPNRADDDEQVLLAVGCQRREIVLFEIADGASRLEPVTTLAIPAADREPTAIHAVRFDRRAESVYAIDDEGRLTRWRLGATAADWSLATVQHSARPPRNQQRPLERVAAAILVPPDGDEIITAGADTLIKFWDVNVPGTLTRFTLSVARPESAKGVADSIKLPTPVADSGRATPTGLSPHIVFDPHDPELLWAACSDGTVQLVNSRSGELLHSVTAHVGGATAIAVLEDRVVVTAGRDRSMCFWSHSSREIHEVRNSLSNEFPLLSVATSHNGRWVASVDSEANLCVWEVASGDRVVFEPITKPDDDVQSTEPPDTVAPPLTGRVAFDRNDKRLAVFGRKQVCAFFSMERLEWLPDKVNVAGRGGTAMLWFTDADNQETGDTLLFSDDYPRRGIYPHTPALAHRFEMNRRNTTKAIVASPDASRLFMLEGDGRLLVCDPKRFGQMLERRRPRGDSCDLAIDSLGSRLAIAQGDGSIEIWETDLPSRRPLDAADGGDRWTEAVRNPSLGQSWITDPRAIIIDSQERINMLAIERTRSEHRDGRLLFLRQAGSRLTCETIDTSVTSGPPSIRVVTGSEGEPIAIYRRRTAERDYYDGWLRIARRDGANSWQIENVAGPGNFGFYPGAVLNGATVTDIFHHQFTGRHLLHARVADDRWHTELIGHWGDGFNLVVHPESDGTAHLFFNRFALDGTPGPARYMFWESETTTELESDWPPSEVISPHVGSVRSVTSLPDGTMIALVGRLQSPLEAPERAVARRVNRRWELERLPSDLAPCVHDLTCTRSGQLLLGGFDPERRKLIFARSQDERWDTFLLGDVWDHPPNHILIRTDSNDRPLIVGLHDDTIGGEVRILRLRD